MTETHGLFYSIYGINLFTKDVHGEELSNVYGKKPFIFVCVQSFARIHNIVHAKAGNRILIAQIGFIDSFLIVATIIYYLFYWGFY